MSTGGENLEGVSGETAVESNAPVVETPEVPDNEAPVEEKADEKESVRESVLKSFNKLKKHGSDENGDESEEEDSAAALGKKVESDEKPEIIKEPKPDALDPELLPPERLNPKAKLLFNNLPKGLKRELHRTIKDLEGMGTRTAQEAARIKQEVEREQGEVRGIKEAISPFAQDWAERGFTVPQGILSLAVAQKKLTDPKTKLPTAVALIRDLQIDPQELMAALNGEEVTQRQSFDITTHPEFRSLQEGYKTLKSTIEQQQVSEAVRPIVNEIETVRQEIDPASGRLLYPELHDDVYLDSLKQRVSELVGNEPGISFGDALLRANAERKERLFGYSAQASPRIPASANNINNRAANAAVSVRGRVGAVGGNGASLEPPASALKNTRATTQWVLENLKRGNIT